MEDKDKIIQELRDEIQVLKSRIADFEMSSSPPAKRNKIDQVDQFQVNPGGQTSTKVKKNKSQRPFDFSKHPKRHVALKFAYLGWDMAGFASQEDSEQTTVEKELFQALEKTRLLESRTEGNYQRCGRTDKGVSAFSQVISLDLRCKSNSGLGVIPLENSNSANNEEEEDLDSEIDYCKILNGVLPPEIRIYAWSPVRPDFSARFDCSSRTYRYYLPTGDLDIQAMRKAAGDLIGTHDFKNFCKIDTRKPETLTVRTILHVKVEEIIEKSDSQPNSIAFVEIKGSGFIWHQIRCIVGLLVLIGQGLEDSTLIKELLESDQKPHYRIALDYPLVLFDVDYDPKEVQWRFSDYMSLLRDYRGIFLQHFIKETMVNQMVESIQSRIKDPKELGSAKMSTYKYIIGQDHSKVYKKIMDRSKCIKSTKNTCNT